MTESVDNINGKAQEKIIDYTLFMAIWDEELGPEVIDFCPKSAKGNLESIAINIFSAYQYFYNKPDEQFKRTKVTLPVASLNKKAYILLEVVYNPEVRGRFQPFIVVLLIPDYIPDNELAVYDGVISKIAKNYVNEKSVLIKEGYQDIDEIYREEQRVKELEFEISDYYSYTAAIDDFKAGVQLFQTRNFDDAYPLLRKALKKFEKEDHKNLIMEVVYLIATLYAQRKEFNIAENYFLRLEQLAEELNHEKYTEMSVFMSGFCAYKNERYVDAINQFLKIELFKKQFINDFQYHTYYGRALASLHKFDDSKKKLQFALRLIESMEQTPLNKHHKGQLTYELGQLYYREAIDKIKQFGINKQDKFREDLITATRFFEDSGDVWIEVGEVNQAIDVYKLIGDIFEIIGDDPKFFEYYKKAFEHAEESKQISYEINILKRIIQKQAILGQYEDNIKDISKFLKLFEGYQLFDLHTAAILYKHLGVALVKTDQIEDGLAELIRAYEILDKFKTPVDDELKILNRIIIISTRLKDDEKIAYYSEQRDIVSEKLKEKEIKEAEKVKDHTIVKDLWIFSKSIGIELYSYSIATEVETDLLGGFMTAMQAMSEQITYKNLDSMIFGDARFTIYQEENRDIYILARSSAKMSEDLVERVLSIIYNRFWKEYQVQIINFQGNVTPFQKFTPILEAFDWTLVSAEEAQEIVTSHERITGVRGEVKQLIQGLPSDQEALPMDESLQTDTAPATPVKETAPQAVPTPTITSTETAVTQEELLKAMPSAEELKAKALAKREKLMKQTPMFMDELKAEPITEEGMEVFKEQRICVVHKGAIQGFMFSCPGCDALYCIKCVEALVDIENECWACNTTLDPSKPSARKAEEKEGDDIVLETKGKDEEAKVDHKAHKAEAQHKAPKADAQHKAPKTEAQHKAPKAEAQHKAPKAEAQHKGLKTEALEEKPKRPALRIAAKKKKEEE